MTKQTLKPLLNEADIHNVKNLHAQITLPPLIYVNRVHMSIVEEPIHSRMAFQDN